MKKHQTRNMFSICFMIFSDAGPTSQQCVYIPPLVASLHSIYIYMYIYIYALRITHGKQVRDCHDCCYIHLRTFAAPFRQGSHPLNRSKWQRSNASKAFSTATIPNRRDPSWHQQQIFHNQEPEWLSILVTECTSDISKSFLKAEPLPLPSPSYIF